MTCDDCGCEIDPDTCQCGEAMSGHGHGSNHGPIPMGCRCYRAEDAETIRRRMTRTAAWRGQNLWDRPWEY